MRFKIFDFLLWLLILLGFGGHRPIPEKSRVKDTLRDSLRGEITTTTTTTKGGGTAAIGWT